MFKHDHSPEDNKPKLPTVEEKIRKPETAEHATTSSQGDLRELMEKNLKWSQIIYEQNRKINHKLLWSAIAGWLRLAIIAVPVILALIALPSLVQDYNCFVRGANCKTPTGKQASVEEMLKYLPLDSAQKEQIKAMLK